jgi:energy-coupling factor transporter ATP-binding protein EcfA2
MFFSSIGELIFTKYVTKEESDGDKDHYFVRKTSYHPGALSFGSVSQRPMQQLFTLTVFKVWVFMYETLKYSTEYLDEYDLCEKIIHDVETWLEATSFKADFQSAKDEIIQTNGELRWRD